MALRLSAARRYIPWLYRNEEHLYERTLRKQLFAYSEPQADFHSDHLVQWWYADPPFYNYWFFSIFAVGMSAAMCWRHMLFNPDVHFRRQEARRDLPDKHRQYAYSLPYYNHSLRNWAARARNSLIDNEPDYANDHPWGIRPNRSLAQRKPFNLFMLRHKYYVDDPLYEQTLHASIEKRYREMGYCVDSEKFFVNKLADDEPTEE